MRSLLLKNSAKRRQGAAILKWLVGLAFLALAVMAGFFYLSDQRARAEMQAMHAAAEDAEKQIQQLQQAQSETQPKPSEENNLELVKLRGEVAKYRAMEKQFLALQTENQQLRANLQQLQQANSETAAIRNQNVQLQGALQERAFTEQCLANLRAIAGAKAQWALENRKGAADMPTDIDLFGRYLPQKPVCPKGGVYNLGTTHSKVTCTTPGHTY